MVQTAGHYAKTSCNRLSCDLLYKDAAADHGFLASSDVGNHYASDGLKKRLNYISKVMYVSINKQPISLQNFIGHLFRLCQGKGLGEQHNTVTGSILPASCGLSGSA